MTAENSVQFKAYLIQNAAEPEIRKFSVARDAVACFVYLKQKLEVIFPSLREAPFIVSWKDADGDLVQIWSDEELIIALSEMPEDCKKIYVVPGSMYRESPSPGQNVHVGVTCDGCEKEVVGFRYKCAICPDYDLCQDCEAKRVHSEHFMIRIPNPVNKDVEFGKRMLKEFHKFNKHAMKGEWKRGGSFRHRSGHHKFGGCPFVPPKAQSCPSNENGMQGESCANQAGPSWFNQSAAVNFENIVESIMQGLMMMAGEVADPPTKEKSSQEPTNQTEKQSVFNKPNIPQKEVHFSQNIDNSIKEDSRSECVSSETPSSSNSKSTVSDMEHEPLDNSWAVLNKVNGNDQKEIQKNVQTLKSDLMNAGGDSQSVYPQLQNSPMRQQMNLAQQANIDPKQKKIEESLARMLNMGFNNEGDFLRQVLTAKNGDIDQVLEMLLPSKRNSSN